MFSSGIFDARKRRRLSGMGDGEADEDRDSSSTPSFASPSPSAPSPSAAASVGGNGYSSPYGGQASPSFTSLANLRVSQLKQFSREELGEILNKHGVPAFPQEESKPALKQKVRLLLSEAEKMKAGALPGTSAVPLVSAPRTEETDWKPCEECDIKKANRECLFNRCRKCCNMRGFNCRLHTYKTTNIGTPSQAFPPPFQAYRNVQLTPMMTSTSPSYQMSPQWARRPIGSGSTTSYQASAQANRPQQTQPQQRPIVPPAAPAPPGQINVKTAPCPVCKNIISCAGSNFLIHLTKCNPEFLWMFMQSGKDLDAIMISQSEREKPVNIARTNARKRYKKNMACLQELFSEIPVQDVLDSIAAPSFDPQRFEERMSNIEKNLERLLNRDSQTMKEMQRRSALHSAYLMKLQRCTTTEEVMQSKKELESECGVHFEEESFPQMVETTGFAPAPSSKQRQGEEQPVLVPL